MSTVTHLDERDPHDHTWSTWMPYDMYGHYRYCLTTGCNATQRRSARTGEVEGA